MSVDLPPRTKQLCTFFVGKTLFGVDVTDVQEVLRAQEMTPVPLSNSVVSGLINLRGQIVTALDLRLQLDMPRRAPGQIPLNIVVRHQDGVVSLLVDEIDDIVEVEAADFEPPPDTVLARTRALIEGVYKLPSRLLLVLSTSLAVHVEPNGTHRRDPS